MATHSSILPGRMPWTEEPGGLQSTWSQSRACARASRCQPDDACTTTTGTPSSGSLRPSDVPGALTGVPRCSFLSGYSNTEMASLHLASDGEQSLHGLAAYHDGPVWGAFTHLGWAVREGAAWTPEPLPQVPQNLTLLLTCHLCR